MTSPDKQFVQIASSAIPNQLTQMQNFSSLNTSHSNLFSSCSAFSSQEISQPSAEMKKQRFFFFFFLPNNK